jgi:signal transduction histidine kinase
MQDLRVKRLLDKTIERHIFSSFRRSIRWYVLPTFLSFGILDWIYSPDHFLLWISLRVCYAIALFFCVGILAKKKHRMKLSNFLAVAVTVIAAWFVLIMIWQSGGSLSIYPPGLMLICHTGITIFQMSRRNILITNAVVYIPAILVMALFLSQDSLVFFIIHSSFFIGMTLLGFISGTSNEKFRFDLIKSRIKLSDQANALSKALSDLHQTQTELVESERMATIGTLSAGIAHEINNAMNFIHQSIPIIKDELRKLNADSDCFEILQIMREGVDRSLDIVKALRLQSSSSTNSIQYTNIKDSLRTTIALLNKKIRDKGVEVKIEYLCENEINTYPGILAQVLTNLITNAIDACPNDRKGIIQIKVETTDQYLISTVTDNGSGIPEAIKNRIFDPFFSTKGPQHGNGLGLYVVKKHLHNINGQIQCQSIAGGPTTFQFRMPFEPITLKIAKII